MLRSTALLRGSQVPGRMTHVDNGRRAPRSGSEIDASCSRFARRPLCSGAARDVNLTCCHWLHAIHGLVSCRRHSLCTDRAGSAPSGQSPCCVGPTQARRGCRGADSSRNWHRADIRPWPMAARDWRQRGPKRRSATHIKRLGWPILEPPSHQLSSLHLALYVGCPFAARKATLSLMFS